MEFRDACIYGLINIYSDKYLKLADVFMCLLLKEHNHTDTQTALHVCFYIYKLNGLHVQWAKCLQMNLSE